MIMAGQVSSLQVSGYRSLENIWIDLDSVNLITGPNGSGKSNLFNAIRLIKEAVEGRLARAIADEGGMESVLWAGPRQKKAVRMTLGITVEPFQYQLELGLRPFSEFPLFPMDPQIKSETLKVRGRALVDRKSTVANIRGIEGPWEMITNLVDSESIFANLQDPEKYSYLFHFREIVRRWMFYHSFRTDSDSPVRRAAMPTFAPFLQEDGSNLGPALYVIQRRGEFEALQKILAESFPGSMFSANPSSVTMITEGIERQITARELSEGTLKFLCLAAACFPVHLPPFVAFNEPETSLNPALFGPLAEIMAHAAQFGQLWVTTHSDQLSKEIVNRVGCKPIRLDKVDGSTIIAT